MSEAPVIAAFDIATSTGVCIGAVGGKPTVMTWNLREARAFRPARLRLFFLKCENLFKQTHIDLVRYEEPMALAVMAQRGKRGQLEIRTTDAVLALHRGLIGVLEVCAVRAGIDDVFSFNVQDARQHLTGKRRFAKAKSGKSDAKAEVMRVAKMLGVEVSNDNEGDAFAGWSYCCALANPRLAHLVTPLFAQSA